MQESEGDARVPWVREAALTLDDDELLVLRDRLAAALSPR